MNLMMSFTFDSLFTLLFYSSPAMTLETICQLCSKPYIDPRILPCLHSFCRQCLHMVIEGSGDKHKMKCPTCQRSITVPEGGVNAIHQNLRLGFKVEVAGYMSRISSGGEKSCDSCINGGKGPAVVFCCTCGHFLCPLCHEHHKSSKIFHHHQTVKLDQESVGQLSYIMTQPTHSEHLCSQPHHEKEELKFYCETCQCLVCRDCTLVLHKDHKIVEVCNIAKVYKDGMREAHKCAQEMGSKLTSAIGTNDKVAKQVEPSREDAKRHINQVFEQLHQAIDERKETLLSQLGPISLSKANALTHQKQQLVKIQDEIGRYTEMTSDILQTFTDHEVVALGDLLSTELKATVKKLGVDVTTCQSSDIFMTLKTDSLMKELSIFGHIMAPSQSTWSSMSAARKDQVYSVEVETKSSEGKRYPYGGLQAKAELRPKSHDGAVVPGKVEDHGDGTHTITLTPQTAGPHQLLITMDGEHVQGSPHDLYVGPNCNPQKVSCKGGPSGIAINDSGDIYVACIGHNCIHVFDQGGHEKRTIGGDGQFNGPRGICIKGDVMYVAEYCNHRIQKLTTGGQFIQTFGQHGSGQGQFLYPISVIIDQRDMMIVADNGNNRVVILDQNGSWRLIINGNVANFTYPYGLALDPQGNIHVTAFESNTIKVFTPDGTHVRSYGDVKAPSDIAIDKEGFSFVGEFGPWQSVVNYSKPYGVVTSLNSIDEKGYSLVRGNCLSIYDPQGNKLSIFDPQGNKIHTVGNLNGPRGVALDPRSGSLYVTNFEANTVLKYSV